MTRRWCSAGRRSSAALTLRASRGLPHSMPSVARPPRLNACSTRAISAIAACRRFRWRSLSSSVAICGGKPAILSERATGSTPPGDACRPMRKPRAILPRWRLSLGNARTPSPGSAGWRASPMTRITRPNWPAYWMRMATRPRQTGGERERRSDTTNWFPAIPPLSLTMPPSSGARRVATHSVR